jgi:hypothetical protein
MDIYVINMAERGDRWQMIKKLYSPYFNLIRVEAVKNENGWVGCFASHKKCLSIAKRKDLQSIVVMEDDCVPFINIGNFVARLQRLKTELDKVGNWGDIVLGGVFGSEPIEIVSSLQGKKELLCRINKGYCTHLVIYNKSSYDFFLRHPMTAPIDNIWYNKISAFVPIPFLANQRQNYSNIANQYVSHIYDNILKTNNALVERWNRKVAVAAAAAEKRINPQFRFVFL